MYYTEFLASINTLSIVLDFDESIKDILKLSINNLNQLVLSTSQNEYIIRLPIPVHELNITGVNQMNSCLNLKIQLPLSKTEAISDKTQSFVNSSNLAWSCSDLKRKTPVADNTNRFTFNCFNCTTKLIDSADYRFLDMPSEFWYEMMDVWHCHKPNCEGATESNKKYDGNLNPGIKDVIIGNCYILCNTENTNPNLKIKSKQITCMKCNHNLGDEQNKAAKIFKWNLKLYYNDNFETFPKYLYIYNTIIDKINISAIRKFKMKLETSDNWLFFWVINVGLNVSINDKILENALKILYYETGSNDDSYITDESIECLNIATDIIESFRFELESANSALPICNKFMKIKEEEVIKNYKISYISGNK